MLLVFKSLSFKVGSTRTRRTIRVHSTFLRNMAIIIFLIFIRVVLALILLNLGTFTQLFSVIWVLKDQLTLATLHTVKSALRSNVVAFPCQKSLPLCDLSIQHKFTHINCLKKMYSCFLRHADRTAGHFKRIDSVDALVLVLHRIHFQIKVDHVICSVQCRQSSSPNFFLWYPKLLRYPVHVLAHCK